MALLNYMKVLMHENYVINKLFLNNFQLMQVSVGWYLPIGNHAMGDDPDSTDPSITNQKKPVNNIRFEGTDWSGFNFANQNAEEIYVVVGDWANVPGVSATSIYENTKPSNGTSIKVTNYLGTASFPGVPNSSGAHNWRNNLGFVTTSGTFTLSGRIRKSTSAGWYSTVNHQIDTRENGEDRRSMIIFRFFFAKPDSGVGTAPDPNVSIQFSNLFGLTFFIDPNHDSTYTDYNGDGYYVPTTVNNIGQLVPINNRKVHCKVDEQGDFEVTTSADLGDDYQLVSFSISGDEIPYQTNVPGPDSPATLYSDGEPYLLHTKLGHVRVHDLSFTHSGSVNPTEGELQVTDEDGFVVNNNTEITIQNWPFNFTSDPILPDTYTAPIKPSSQGEYFHYMGGNDELSIKFLGDHNLTVTHRPVNYTDVFYDNILVDPHENKSELLSISNTIASYKLRNQNGTSMPGVFDLSMFWKVNGLTHSLLDSPSGTYYHETITNSGRGILAFANSDGGTHKLQYKGDFYTINNYVVPRQIIDNNSTGNTHRVSLLAVVDKNSVDDYLNGVDIRVARQWSNMGLYIPKYGINTIGKFRNNESLEVTLNAATNSDTQKSLNNFRQTIEHPTINPLRFLLKSNKNLPLSQRCQHYIIFPKDIISGIRFGSEKEYKEAKYIYVKAVYAVTKNSNEYTNVSLNSIQGIGAAEIVKTGSKDLTLKHKSFAMYVLKPGTVNNRIIGFQIMVLGDFAHPPNDSKHPGDWSNKEFKHINLISTHTENVIDTRKPFLFVKLLDRDYLASSNIQSKVYNIDSVEFCSQQSDFESGFNGNTELDTDGLPVFDDYDYRSDISTTNNNSGNTLFVNSMHQRVWVIKKFSLVGKNFTTEKYKF